MYFGIGPTLVARRNGTPIKVVASNVIEQIAGIARALAVHPELLLMDEPFGALDAITRQTLQDELLRIWHATGTIILFVTRRGDLSRRPVLLLGGAPTGISGIYQISAPRPRQRGDASLLGVMHKLKADLSDLLQEGAGT